MPRSVTRPVRIALAALFFCTLPARCGIPQPLFGDRDLSPKLLGTLSLAGDEPGELATPCFGSRPLAKSCVTRRFSVPEALFLSRNFVP